MQTGHQAKYIVNLEGAQASQIGDGNIQNIFVGTQSRRGDRSAPSRVDALSRAVGRARAKRAARLSALVPENKVEEVVSWMTGLGDPIVEVAEGRLRVLIAPMGAGKTEQALRWLEEGISLARDDDTVEIPVWLSARRATGDLETAIVEAVGTDPVKACRVVIDDLDSIGEREADCLLAEARELVKVWPLLSVLATSRLGLAVSDQEVIRLDAWPARRGAELLWMLVGDAVPWNLWTQETEELLESPLSVLALAARLSAGGDLKVSRLQLLSDLAGTIIRSRHSALADDDTWLDLARLAARVLGGSGRVRAASFGSEPRVQRLTATDLVVNDGGLLTFALPLFEQHFGAQAIISNVVSLESAASPRVFPRWRYAVAFAVSTSEALGQEGQMVCLARVNPAAALWVLGEVAPGEVFARSREDRTDAAILALISERGGTAGSSPGFPESGLAVLAVSWLREAEAALLDGLGPLANSLARHHEGQLVQWGAWLESGFLTIAEARTTVPLPAVIQLDSRRPEITIVSGWGRVTWFKFPDAEFGRWLWTRERLRKGLRQLINLRTLPVPATSPLAQERVWLLAQFVMTFRARSQPRTIAVPDLRQEVGQWMEQTEGKVNKTWRDRGKAVQSADVRWLHSQLELTTGEVLESPWPEPDRPHAASKWTWRTYSPELTLTIAKDVLQAALTGYRHIVEMNFSNFGAALGLYSLLPARIEGIVHVSENDPRDPRLEILIQFIPDLSTDAGLSAVSLQLITSNDAGQQLYEFAQTRQKAFRSTFRSQTIEEIPLGLYASQPATNLAYEWLERDLKAIGWLGEGPW